MRAPGRRRVRAALLGLLLLAWTGTAGAHPIHTTLTQIGYDREARAVTLSVRVFADDFGTALARLPYAGSFEAASLAYARRTLTLRDSRGRSIPLGWCGARKTGVVIWLCLRAPSPRGLSGMTIHNRMHFELFDDQVNLVQATVNGRKRSVLFTRGDRPKTLR